jgi:hypothetical protein
MQPMHPAIADALYRARVEELTRTTRPTRRTGSTRRRAPAAAVRRRAGWFLVHVGLRLALPRPAVRVAAR